MSRGERMTVAKLHEILTNCIKNGLADWTVDICELEMSEETSISYNHMNKSLNIRPSAYDTMEIEGIRDLMDAMRQAEELLRKSMVTAELKFVNSTLNTTSLDKERTCKTCKHGADLRTRPCPKCFMHSNWEAKE